MEERLTKAIGKVEQLTVNDFENKLKLFFTRLGYKNLILKQGRNKNEINVSGTFLKNSRETKMQALCIFSEEEQNKNWDELFRFKDEKLFIVSLRQQGKKPNFKLPQNAAYLNQELFMNYLVHFKLI